MLFFISTTQEKTKLLRQVEIVPGELSGSIYDHGIETLVSELEKVPTLDILNGPIAFALAGPLCGRKPKGFPHFPAVWTAAVKGFGKNMIIPDDLFKLIWRD